MGIEDHTSEFKRREHRKKHFIDYSNSCQNLKIRTN
jgi:hypothetical protein